MAAKKSKDEYKMSEIISVVSHQLKTPLAAIKGYLEVLVSKEIGDVNEKQLEYLSDALTNAQIMTALVKDLLDVSRIEEGKMEISPKPGSLQELIRETVSEFSSLSHAKNCAVSFNVKGEVPDFSFDPLKIKQAASNIIANAINYNKKKGGVDVVLEKKGDNVVFSCKDTGIGILEKEKKEMSKKFFRSEKAMALSAEGSGLGLFISKAIIEKSGGKL